MFAFHSLSLYCYSCTHWSVGSVIFKTTRTSYFTLSTGVDRVTAAVKGYRDGPVIAQTTPVLPRSEVTVHVEGRSKPYGLSVTEFLFPFKICQSSLCAGEEMGAIHVPSRQFLLETVF